MASTTEIKVLINAKDNASNALASVSKAVASLGNETEKTNAQLSKATKIFGAVFKGLGIAAAGFSALALGTGLAASRVDELRLALQSIAKANNISQIGIDNFVTSLRSLGIEESKALQATSLFIQAQLNLTDALKLARVAQDLAVISGQDSSEALLTLTQGIANQSVLMLRNFGILTTLTEAYDAYADSIDKNADELTDAEKKQALLNVVLKEGAKVAGTYESAMESASKQLRSFTGRELVEFKAAVGRSFEPAILSLIENMRELTSKATLAANIISSFASPFQQLLAPVGAAIIVIGFLTTGLIALNFILPRLGLSMIRLATIVKVLGFFFLNPLGLAIMAVVAFLGFFALKALNAVQAANKIPKSLDGLEDAAKGAGASMKAMGKETIAALKDIDKQISKTTRAFKEQLAEIVRTHKDKVSDLRDQLRQEAEDFKKNQLGIEDDFAEATADIASGRNDRLADLEDKLRAENNKMAFADRLKISNLEKSIAEENQKHDEQFAKLSQDRSDDLADIKNTFEEKKSALQTELDSELAFLKKHNKSVLAVKGTLLLDEIELLKRNHVEQIEELKIQKGKVISKAREQTVGINKELGKIGKGLDLSDAGKQLGEDMAKAFKKEFIREIKDFWTKVQDNFKFIFSKEGLSGPVDTILKRLNRRAEGGPVQSGASFLVGERGPELFVPKQTGNIVSNEKLQSGGVGTTFNITLNIGTLIDSDTTRRNFAERLLQDIDNIATMKGKKANLIT